MILLASIILGIISTIALLARQSLGWTGVSIIAGVGILSALAMKKSWDMKNWNAFISFLLVEIYAALRISNDSAVLTALGVIAVVVSILSVILILFLRSEKKTIIVEKEKPGLEGFYEEFQTPPQAKWERTNDDYLAVNLDDNLDKIQERLESLDKMMRDAEKKRKKQKEKQTIVKVVQAPKKKAKKPRKKNTKPFVRTKAGKKYHMPDCFMIRKVDVKKRERITRAFARKSRLTPCGVCKPQ